MRKHALSGATATTLAVTFAFGYWHWHGQERRDRPYIEPPLLDFRNSPIVRGEAVEAAIVLHNPTNKNLLLKHIQSTCGCLMVAGNDQRLDFPVSVNAGAELPLRVHLGTGNAVGPIQHRATFQLSYFDNSPIEAIELALTADVIVPLLAVQDTFYGEYDVRKRVPVNVTVILVGAGPVHDVGIKHMTSSDPKRVKCDFVPISGEMDVGSFKMRKRYELRLECTPDPHQDDFSETVTVLADYPNLKPLTIRVWGKVRRGYELSTREIVFAPRPAGQPRSCEVEFRWTDAADGDLEVDRLPNGIACEIKTPASDRKVLSFTMKQTEAEVRLGAEVVLRVGRERELVRLPLTAYAPLR